MSDGPLTVRGLLDANLPTIRRMPALQDLCAQFTGQPLDVTIASLGDALSERIGLEDYRRLHILISHLYHTCGADDGLTTELRAEVNNAFARRGEPIATTPERG